MHIYHVAYTPLFLIQNVASRKENVNLKNQFDSFANLFNELLFHFPNLRAVESHHAHERNS